MSLVWNVMHRDWVDWRVSISDKWSTRLVTIWEALITVFSGWMMIWRPRPAFWIVAPRIRESFPKMTQKSGKIGGSWKYVDSPESGSISVGVERPACAYFGDSLYRSTVNDHLRCQNGACSKITFLLPWFVENEKKIHMSFRVNFSFWSLNIKTLATMRIDGVADRSWPTLCVAPVLNRSEIVPSEGISTCADPKWWNFLSLRSSVVATSTEKFSNKFAHRLQPDPWRGCGDR